MPSFRELVRVRLPRGYVWRACHRCGQLAALPGHHTLCHTCTTPTTERGPAVTR
jgi:hypothetical protein